MIFTNYISSIEHVSSVRHINYISTFILRRVFCGSVISASSKDKAKFFKLTFTFSQDIAAFLSFSKFIY